jgi:hypothetical protein
LRRWDRLGRERRVPAIGSSDAHADWYQLGPIRRQVFSYAHVFHRVTNHLLLPEPLPTGADLAAVAIYEALAEGRSFIANDFYAPAHGFRFAAQLPDGASAPMGAEVAWNPDVLLQSSLPSRGLLRLVRDGQPLLETDTGRLAYRPTCPGVYRVEALRRYAGRWRGWIYSNAIYLR